MITNIPTPEGRELGAEFARLTENSIRESGEAIPRCDTCAFRAGTLANGSVVTLANAIKAAFEDDVFLCHENMKPCRGWLHLRRAVKERHLTMPWDYVEGRNKLNEGDVILLPDYSQGE